LCGEFDLAAHDALRAALADHGSAKAIVIDLTQVSFIDAATVGLLLEAHAAATGLGCTLRVVGAVGVVHRVLEILDPSPVLRCGD
jgi:anti-anti-sigma factor